MDLTIELVKNDIKVGKKQCETFEKYKPQSVQTQAKRGELPVAMLPGNQI